MQYRAGYVASRKRRAITLLTVVALFSVDSPGTPGERRPASLIRLIRHTAFGFEWKPVLHLELIACDALMVSRRGGVRSGCLKVRFRTSQGAGGGPLRHELRITVILGSWGQAAPGALSGRSRRYLRKSSSPAECAERRFRSRGSPGRVASGPPERMAASGPRSSLGEIVRKSSSTRPPSISERFSVGPPSARSRPTPCSALRIPRSQPGLRGRSPDSAGVSPTRQGCARPPFVAPLSARLGTASTTRHDASPRGALIGTSPAPPTTTARGCLAPGRRGPG